MPKNGLSAFEATYERGPILGRGASGVAFVVRPKGGPEVQQVAKEICVGRFDEKRRKDAFEESKLLRGLAHINVVKCLDTFLDDEVLYIVMEYADGGDLGRRILARRRENQLFPEITVMSVFVQICAALHHIHSRRVLHRDLKPANVFIVGEGDLATCTAKLGDFGIAKMLECTSCQAHSTVGTPSYLSPEICKNHPYGMKSDIWSLGVVLYELSVLKVPFQAGNLPAMALMICTDSPQPLPDSFSTDLDNLTKMLLQKDPAKRPPVGAVIHNSYVQQFMPEELVRTVGCDSAVQAMPNVQPGQSRGSSLPNRVARPEGNGTARLPSCGPSVRPRPERFLLQEDASQWCWRRSGSAEMESSSGTGASEKVLTRTGVTPRVNASHSRRSERGGERSQRGERGERAERADRGERADHSERVERAQRSERGERGDRGTDRERAGKAERAMAADRTDRADRANPRADRTDRGDRLERVDRGDRGADRADRGDRVNRDAERADRNDRALHRSEPALHRSDAHRSEPALHRSDAEQRLDRSDRLNRGSRGHDRGNRSDASRYASDASRYAHGDSSAQGEHDEHAGECFWVATGTTQRIHAAGCPGADLTVESVGVVTPDQSALADTTDEELPGTSEVQPPAEFQEPAPPGAEPPTSSSIAAALHVGSADQQTRNRHRKRHRGRPPLLGGQEGGENPEVRSPARYNRSGPLEQGESPDKQLADRGPLSASAPAPLPLAARSVSPARSLAQVIGEIPDRPERGPTSLRPSGSTPALPPLPPLLAPRNHGPQRSRSVANLHEGRGEPLQRGTPHLFRTAPLPVSSDRGGDRDRDRDATPGPLPPSMAPPPREPPPPPQRLSARDESGAAMRLGTKLLAGASGQSEGRHWREPAPGIGRVDPAAALVREGWGDVKTLHSARLQSVV